ncbi:fumarylacetoacetate hydrolase [Thalassobaculum fulvum]|uniref:Fumarylacetoacetate hydrolase n=1 Tax=Thalassobaculum fulvum TaxID=1633335 RepID=A0A918XV94_9PROT|nr:fumarylacetoacetate hydrolase family protein [Thalassobaculum fulvum]GHD57533.1 fumarylacetoacetate hydrolase [Thalassobaculum fulvum]
MAELNLTVEACLPEDRRQATLVGRVWRPDADGPSVVALRGDRVVDISAAVPTVSELINRPDAAALARDAAGEEVGTVGEILANSAHDRRDPSKPWLLCPSDLQAIKACGVTFAESMLERVIEEKAKGDASAADAIRGEIVGQIGLDLSKIVPGSDEAMQLKDALIERGMWSQYLEVGIGPDAEVFTKAPPLAGVGVGAEVGLHPISSWNNPEPEVVLAIAADGRIAGATLGNDVNLRDVEGRSALLLGKAKDNNGSAALGPFIRLFDDGFGLDDVRSAELDLRVEGEDGFVLDGHSSMKRISRDVADLAAHAIGPHHQYPDGLVLMTGTLFAPTKDRDAPGQGFTHKLGDVVTIRSARLGALVNRVGRADRIPPWTFGAGALMRNLARRGLI